MVLGENCSKLTSDEGILRKFLYPCNFTVVKKCRRHEDWRQVSSLRVK